MICDISNAYPSNIAVDADHNVQFHFVFFGDGCKEADFIFYDSTYSTSEPELLPIHLYDERRIYYNGEEIDANTNGGTIGGKFVNGRSYIWKVRMYEEVSIGDRKYPSVHRTSGEISEPPYFFGKVQASTGELKDTEIPIEKNLNITLPMWMRIGSDPTYRIVNSYNEATGVCILKHAFDKKPTEGAEYSLCSVRSYVPTKEIDSNQLFIEKGITEFNGAEYEASGKSVNGYCWYMEINGVYTAITGYDPVTGLITLEDAVFSAKEPGDKYNIWTSFIDSRFYAITTKESPKFRYALGYPDGENIFFEAELSDNHLVNYYWLDIYEDDVLVETTKCIRMAKLNYYYRKAKVGKEYHAVFHVLTQDGMVNQEDASWWKSSMEATNITNKCKLINFSKEAVGGVSVSLDSEKRAVKLMLLGTPILEGTLVSGNSSDLSKFHIGAGLEFEVASGQYLVLNGTKTVPVKSYSKATGELITSVPVSSYFPAGTAFRICAKLKNSNMRYRVLRQYEDETVLVGNFKEPTIYDYTCASNTQYQYIIQPYILNTQEDKEHKWIGNFYNEAISSVTTPMGREWAIYGLNPTKYTAITNDDTRIFYPYQDDYSTYSVTEIWLAALDVEPTQQTTHNINKVIYSGDHPKPVAVSGKSDYDSFTLSFTIGEANCPGNKIILGTVKDIKQWKNFTAHGDLVMLKDPDGNVWAGAITSDSYELVHYGARTEYKVSFEFTELKDVNHVVIQN